MDDSNGGYGFAPRPGTSFGVGSTIGNGQNANRARALGTQMGGAPAYHQNYGNATQARGEQMNALGMTRDAAMGNAPSRAEILGKTMIGDSLNAQMAGAASARGGPMGQASAQRQAGQGAAAFQQTGANNIAGMRADEMAHARDAYAGQAGAVRSGDLSTVGMTTQNQQFQRGLDAQQRLAYEGMANGLDTTQAQMDQQNGQFEQGLQQQNDQFGRNLSEQHWAGQAGLNQHAVDRSTGLWSTIGGGLLSGAGGVVGGLLKSDPRSKTNVRDMTMGGKVDYTREHRSGDGGPLDVEYIKYGQNADQGALDDRYAQMSNPPAPWMPDYMASQQAPPMGPYASSDPNRLTSASGYRAQRGNAMGGDMFASDYEGDNDWSKPQSFGGSPATATNAATAPGTDDWNATGGDAAQKADVDWTNGGSTKPAADNAALGDGVTKGLGDMGGGLQHFGSQILMKSDPRSKLGIMPMNAVDPGTGTVQLHDGGMSSSDLLAAGTGLAGPQPVQGMVGGGGITGGSVNTAGRGSDGTVDLSISDPEAKRQVYEMGKSHGRQDFIDDVLAPKLGNDTSHDMSKASLFEKLAYANAVSPIGAAIDYFTEKKKSEGKPAEPASPSPAPSGSPVADIFDRDSQYFANPRATTKQASSGDTFDRDAQYFADPRDGNVRAAPPARMMDSIGGGKTFQYRPGIGEDPTKQHFGTTTEDLKKTPMGASMVEPGGPLTDGFDAINTKEAVGPTLAALGNLNQRLRLLETPMGGKGRK